MRQLLATRHKQHIVDASRVNAAVLVPVNCHQGQYYILFTKRTEKVSTHKGQISFPGGAQDGGETLLDTALREAAEEIGLTADNVDILGELDDQLSVASNYTISPFVGIIPRKYHFKLNEDEAEEIIEVPISALLDEDCLQQKTMNLDGELVTSYFYRYGDRVIWGATARILNQFLEIFARAMSDSHQANCQS